MIRPLFALVAVGVLIGSARADDEKLPGPKINWPEVKGLERQKPNLFKDKSLGYSISYVGGGTIATVFVYDLGMEKIPDGPNADKIKAEMYESLLALEANRKSGRYKSISPLDEAVIALGSAKGAPQMRRKRYEVDIAKDGPSITELYITGYKGYFLKIRATYPVEDKQKGEKHVAALLEALGTELK